MMSTAAKSRAPRLLGSVMLVMKLRQHNNNEDNGRGSAHAGELTQGEWHVVGKLLG